MVYLTSFVIILDCSSLEGASSRASLLFIPIRYLLRAGQAVTNRESTISTRGYRMQMPDGSVIRFNQVYNSPYHLLLDPMVDHPY
jgi:hypothetical protein